MLKRSGGRSCTSAEIYLCVCTSETLTAGYDRDNVPREMDRRILQWFAHNLKGEAPTAWITKGQIGLERKTVLDASMP